jgi:hypothetical protein
LPPGAEADPFTPVAELVTEPIPETGLDLPLDGNEYRGCLPHASACSDDGSGLVLVPARSSEIQWHALEGTELPGTRSDLKGVEPIPPVGVGPEDPRAKQYVLPMLDLTNATSELRGLVRALDGPGSFVLASGEAPLFVPSVEGPDASVQGSSGDAPARSPFGRPEVVRGASLTELAPVIPMYASDAPQLLAAIRADAAWDLNMEVLPLVGESLPFLARRVDGPPGLFVALPEGLRVPAPPPS